MTDVHEPTYQQRKAMEAAGIPFGQRWGAVGCYLASWIEARKEGRKLSVSSAAAAAGLSTDALRQRRRYDADFRAAEVTARTGEPYTPPGVDEAQDVVVADPLTTDVTWPPRPAPPQPEIERPLAVSPTNTTLAEKPRAKKIKPSRRWGVPSWTGGSGYEHLD